MIRLYNSINLSYLFDLDFVSIGKNKDLKSFEEEGIAFISESNAETPSMLFQGPSGFTTVTQGEDPNIGKVLVVTDSTEKEKKELLNDFEALWVQSRFARLVTDWKRAPTVILLMLIILAITLASSIIAVYVENLPFGLH